MTLMNGIGQRLIFNKLQAASIKLQAPRPDFLKMKKTFDIPQYP
jgi:hypothetical protein